MPSSPSRRRPAVYNHRGTPGIAGGVASTWRSSEVSSGAVRAEFSGGAGRGEAGGLVRRDERGEGEINPGDLARSARAPVASTARRGPRRASSAVPEARRLCRLLTLERAGRRTKKISSQTVAPVRRVVATKREVKNLLFEFVSINACVEISYEAYA